jgi:hypothetical protein
VLTRLVPAGGIATLLVPAGGIATLLAAFPLAALGGPRLPPSSAGLCDRGDDGVHRFTHGAFIATTVRRAAETGDALTARGGIGTIAGPDQRPGVRDGLAALFAAAILTARVLL